MQCENLTGQFDCVLSSYGHNSFKGVGWDTKLTDPPVTTVPSAANQLFVVLGILVHHHLHHLHPHPPILSLLVCSAGLPWFPHLKN